MKCQSTLHLKTLARTSQSEPVFHPRKVLNQEAIQNISVEDDSPPSVSGTIPIVSVEIEVVEIHGYVPTLTVRHGWSSVERVVIVYITDELGISGSRQRNAEHVAVDGCGDNVRQ